MLFGCGWFLGGKRRYARSLAEGRLDIFRVSLRHAALDVAVSSLHFSDLFLMQCHLLELRLVGHPAERWGVSFKGRTNLWSVL